MRAQEPYVGGRIAGLDVLQGIVRRTFELDGEARMLAMEGVRGIAVSLVFLHHYATQWLDPPYSGDLAIWRIAHNYGNQGVELFFVLSGFLIYGALIKRRTDFVRFMARRAERLYPAFLVTLAIALANEAVVHSGKLPTGVVPALAYLIGNLLFLPGLFPIIPLLTVAWSLSYEVFFYVVTAALVIGGALHSRTPCVRVALLVTITTIFAFAAWAAPAAIPVRMLSFFGGMLLLEAYRAGRAVPWIIGAIAPLAAAIVFAVVDVPAPGVVREAGYAIGFCLLCGALFGTSNPLSRALAWEPLRWLGNMSYSYYLMHGFAVVVLVKAARESGIDAAWALLPITFAATIVPSAALFVLVEKPLSLQRQKPSPTTGFH
jgi:peptidoglycan/LPS O-acetylase OafA/YrhL